MHLCLVLAALAQATPAHAQSQDELADLEDELAIAPVLVTAARIEAPAEHAAVATDVVTREDVDRSGARDAAELLEEQPSLQLQRSFRGIELWIRGLEPEHTLVLVDGMRVPGATGGAVDLSRFGVEMLERIEIVRGPSSALYGSEAIGGVVNLITRDLQRDLELDASARYGGPGHVSDATALAGVRLDPNTELRVTGGFHYADAFRRDPARESTAGSSRLQWSVGGRGQWRAAPYSRLRLQADYGQRELRGTDAGAGSALFDRTQLQEQLQCSFEHAIDGRDGLRLRTRLVYSLHREQYLLDQRGSTQLDRYEDNREHLGQLASILRIPATGLGQHGITIGVEQLAQQMEAARLERPGLRTRLAFFAQDEWIVVEERDLSFTVAPGVRVDLDSQFGAQLSPKIALRFDPVQQLILRASYGRGFRAPSFQELLLRFENPSVGYVVRGNPNLGAETAGGVDVGFEWRPERWITLSASFFRNDLENMITPVTAEESVGGRVFTYENLASAWTMGLETAGRLRVDDLVTVTASYTLTETWDGENERHLEARARHRFTLGALFSYEPWEIEIGGRAALQLDRIFYVDADGDGFEDAVYGEPIAQIDLRVAKGFTRHFEIFAGIDNLLDAGDAYTVLRPFTVYGGARGRY